MPRRVVFLSYSKLMKQASPLLLLQTITHAISTIRLSFLYICFFLPGVAAAAAALLLNPNSTMRRRSMRLSSSLPEDVLNTTHNTTGGSFSTKFSVVSFVKRLEKLTDDQKNAIKKTGFGSLLLIPSRTLSKNLLAELMDRWDVQNQAFLLELRGIPLTVGLFDIALILGLRVLGKVVCLDEVEDQPLLDLEYEYGADSTKRLITVSSLERRLDSLGGNAGDDFIRTFLLFTFGTFLFPNSNGKVDSRYLSFLIDLENVSQFAWGKAVLDDLVIWLGRRKEDNIQSVGGCLFCLQIWAFEHIDIARPSLTENCLAFPRACRWENSKSHQRQWFTTRFQELQDQQIVWELQPTPEEFEMDVVKELVGVESKGIELQRAIKISEAVLSANEDNLEIRGKTELETDTIVRDQEVQDTGLEQKASGKKIDSLLDSADFQSTLCCVPEILQEHVELELTSEESSPCIIADHDDNLRSKNQILEQQVMTMKKANDELKKENELLRVQLLQSEQTKEHVTGLEKEVEVLRRKNELLSRSSNILVERLEKVLLNDDEVEEVDVHGE